MSLQIDLFSDRDLLTKTSRSYGYMLGRMCTVVGDLSEYKELQPTSMDESYHVRQVLENMDKERKYVNLFGNHWDSHTEIEKLGVCSDTRRYSVIVSLEDSLDYLLHRISNASMMNLRAMPNYTQVSRAILRQDYEGLSDVSLGDLMDADPALSEYIVGMYNRVICEDPEERAEKFMAEFTKEVLSKVSPILVYVSMYLYNNLPPKTIVMRSKSLCSFVLSSNENIQEELSILSRNFDEHKLFVRSFEKMEYKEKSGLLYA